MSKFKAVFLSRTNWTIAMMFTLNGLQAIQPHLSGKALIIANAILSLIAIYFKMNPSQNYAPEPTPQQPQA